MTALNIIELSVFHFRHILMSHAKKPCFCAELNKVHISKNYSKRVNSTFMPFHLDKILICMSTSYF